MVLENMGEVNLKKATSIKSLPPDLKDLFWDVQKKLLHEKRRYFYLSALLNEIERRVGKEPFNIQNDIVWQMMLDSVYMLIINLLSVCKSMVREGGFFDILAMDVKSFNLAKVVPEDSDVEKLIKREADIAKRGLFPEAYLRPKGTRILLKDIHQLKTRFEEIYEALRLDRNKFRAHQYDFDQSSGPEYEGLAALGLDDIGKKFQEIESFINDVATATGHPSMDLDDMNNASCKRTAKDLMDLVMLRDINSTVAEIGINEALKNQEGKLKYYWGYREQFDELYPDFFRERTKTKQD